MVDRLGSPVRIFRPKGICRVRTCSADRSRQPAHPGTRVPSRVLPRRRGGLRPARRARHPVVLVHRERQRSAGAGVRGRADVVGPARAARQARVGPRTGSAVDRSDLPHPGTADNRLCVVRRSARLRRPAGARPAGRRGDRGRDHRRPRRGAGAVHGPVRPRGRAGARRGGVGDRRPLPDPAAGRGRPPAARGGTAGHPGHPRRATAAGRRARGAHPHRPRPARHPGPGTRGQRHDAAGRRARLGRAAGRGTHPGPSRDRRTRRESGGDPEDHPRPHSRRRRRGGPGGRTATAVRPVADGGRRSQGPVPHGGRGPAGTRRPHGHHPLPRRPEHAGERPRTRPRGNRVGHLPTAPGPGGTRSERRRAGLRPRRGPRGRCPRGPRLRTARRPGAIARVRRRPRREQRAGPGDQGPRHGGRPAPEPTGRPLTAASTA